MQEKLSDKVCDMLVKAGYPAREVLAIGNEIARIELDANELQQVRTRRSQSNARYYKRLKESKKERKKGLPHTPSKERKKETLTLSLSIPNGIDSCEGATGDSVENGSHLTGIRAELWRDGTRVLMDMTGLPESRAKANIGRFLKLAKDDCARVLKTVRQAQSDQIGDPIPWITAGLQGKGRTQNDVKRDIAKIVSEYIASGPPGSPTRNTS